uniref:Sugar porter family MFS transporter n=1 Tax=Roseihalotalea indica TaxID=2867963 RepID=A0AA49JCD9_9BACT|nr:sugar porter family MFS transporter [Tunicatimonas sp. TK19036]
MPITKNKVFKYVFIVSIAGFLFGFDTVVISGVNLPIKNLWQTSDWFHGTFIISMSLWGTVMGALLGGYPTEKLGRKVTLTWVGVMFTISAMGASLAPGPYFFSVFRFIGGLSAGIASIAVPTYISEISKAHNRGSLGMLFQFNIVFGILIAYLSNYILTGVLGSDDWRLMLGIEVVPALLFSLLVLNIPKSPRWLIVHKKNTTEARRIAALISSEAEANHLIEAIQYEPDYNREGRSGLFSGKYNRVLKLSFLIAFFNQFSGISFILFYAPEILEKAGFATSDSLLSSVLIGVVNLVFTFVGIYLIDRVGRKQLMYIGSTGYIVSLSMIAYGFHTSLSATFQLVFLLLFITSHAVGQGAVIWVFISEIFPTRIRSFGQAWGSGVLNVFAALIALFGSVLINALAPWVVFALFAFFMFLQLLFTHFMMPETKGASLEELEKNLIQI